MYREFLNMMGAWSSGAVFGRLLLALFAGALIGIDRGLKRRGAGIKTHALVCLGSALVMLTGAYISNSLSINVDITRMGAQVISGVGFLGVGTILVTGRHRVRGLTTAAGLWTCACVGLSIGIGFVEGAIYSLVLIVVILKFLNKLECFLQKHAKIFELYLELDSGKYVGCFLRQMRNKNIKVAPVETIKNKFSDELFMLIVTLEVEQYKTHQTLIDEIRSMDYVQYVEEM